ncbi:hypothetical protein MBAV_004622 [Candidatus Magnetobacterium bavaricum]|uniref:Uncharacterized protein n=1 Tax=Candidatus Magnetobacterium bavaricum TaxID=29290 RepID=A0A0F3GR42_9BACT|nr:hypothetical protein MBAV_004622 [Candidatus Magnetobacterium bavaricum]
MSVYPIRYVFIGFTPNFLAVLITDKKVSFAFLHLFFVCKLTSRNLTRTLAVQVYT